MIIKKKKKPTSSRPREPSRSLPRCGGDVNVPRYIYNGCFLYTFLAESNGTVHHRRDGMGSPV